MQLVLDGGPEAGGFYIHTGALVVYRFASSAEIEQHERENQKH
jgi:hypothetical protein